MTSTVRLDQRIDRVKQWALQAVDHQWLISADLEVLEVLDARTPATLFDPQIQRPLIAAFFGGTGVGKSSLLNRLAGEPIARTGVERPTSQEVSLYVHESIHLKTLPNDMPLDRVRMGRHRHEALRQVLWVDMPDIDSVDEDNRQLVLDWLPHIDVLLYVVSPERYRDDKGWRLLKDCGGDHAWLFILNQWDRGEQVQLDDFKRLLSQTGFQDPIVLTTICRDILTKERSDDFHSLEDVLQKISNRHLLEQLESRAELIKFHAASEAVETLLQRLGPPSSQLESLDREWLKLWEDSTHDLMTGLEWPMRALVTLYTGRDAHPVRRSLDLTLEEERNTPKVPEDKPLLWDDWALGRTQDAVTQLLVLLGEKNIPLRPARQRLLDWPEETGKTVIRQGQLQLRQSLAEPGNALQRGMMKLASALSLLLPVLAIGWASYQVVKGYYDSALNHLDYLGSDFAIHSLLLIGLAWLMPWFLYTRLKPSMEASALKGLRNGVSSGLGSAGDSLRSELQDLEIKRTLLISEGRALLDQLKAPESLQAGHVDLSPLLRRMVPK